MYTEQPASSSASSTTSTTDTDQDPDISSPAISFADLGPAPEQRSASSALLPNNAHLGAERLFLADTRSYTPHAVGIGLLSVRPPLNPVSTLVRESAFQPAQAESSSHAMRLNPLENALHQTGADLHGSPLHRSDRHMDESDDVPPVSPSLVNAEASAVNATLSPPHAGGGAASPPTSTGGGGGLSLRVIIPPAQPHHPGNPFVHSGPALSPPPLSTSSTPPSSSSSSSSPPPHQPELGLQAPAQGSHASLDLAQELPFGGPNASEPALNLDFAEFDFEGLSTLEKIYLFSRSRAGFQRVFIAHALPGFLRSGLQQGDDTARDAASADPSEPPAEVDEITPADAVEYVLPLLNGLAMDDDEAVKEALAAELVPIIWWFITHCRLVEDDPAPAFESSTGTTTDEPTQISVQAFTPILGTLLLSPNGLVGGPARYAVVELLSRVRRADTRERRRNESSQHHDTARDDARTTAHTQDELGQEEDDNPPVGLFGSPERRLFEREMVYQVVIGMGRLDIPEEGAYEDYEAEAEHIPDTTAMPTPHAQAWYSQVRENDSYFPPMDPIPDAAETEVLSSASSVEAELLPVEQEQEQRPFPALPTPSASTSEGNSPASVESTPPLTSESSSTSSTPAPSIATLTPPTPTALSESSDKEEEVYEVTSPVRSPDRVEIVQEWIPTTTVRPLSPRSTGEIDPSGRVGSPWLRSPISPRLNPFLHPTSRSPSPRSLSPFTASSSSTPPSLELSGPASPIEHISLDRPASPIPDIVSPIPEHSLASDLLHPAFHDDSEAADPDSLFGPPGEDQGSEAVDETQLNEEASVGRLSSMSLMAAVTASGPIDNDTKSAFVVEVERVGRDPVYWVRREASFAVGALAKVVSEEVVLTSLLPLFETLYHDPSWHVRHSALFALPAILSKLSPERRRALALDVILTLAQDESMTVRAGVLEALAEVIYTFHEDEERPPNALLRLFLGIREDDDPRRHEMEEDKPAPSSPASSLSWSDFVASISSGANDGPEIDIYDDPSRPLVCAFNLPAVALTLGRERWGELRELYQELTNKSSFKVRRTLAASLGELAKIIGPEQAHSDLMPVWWASVRSEEGDIRLKTLECIEAFVGAIGEADRAEVLAGLEERVWPVLRGWRERECVAKALPAFAAIEGVDARLVWHLARRALLDSAATIRETAVSSLSALLDTWSSRAELAQAMWADINSLGISSSFKERMTFLACQQAVLQSVAHPERFINEASLSILSDLSEDPIVDVRIRVARFLGSFTGRLSSLPELSQVFLDLATKLGHDPSCDVKAFALPLVSRWPPVRTARKREPPEIAKSTANFSRPPPSAPS